MTIISFLKTHRIVIVIIAAGLLLRLPLIGWGIPLVDDAQRVYHPDEPKIIIAAYKFPPHLSVLPHPTLYHYLVGALSYPLKKIFPVTHPMVDAEGFFRSYYAVNIFARVVTVLFGCGAILLTYLLGRQLYDRKKALIAAAMVAFSSIHVITSAVAITYVPLSFFVLLGFYTLFGYAGKPHHVGQVVAIGLCSGLIMATKFTGIFFLVPVIFYCVAYRQRALPVLARDLVMIIVIGFALVLLTTPNLIWAETWVKVMSEFSGFTPNNKFILSPALWLHNIRALFAAVGLPLAGAFIGGLLFFRRRSKEEVAILLFIASLFIYFRIGFSLRGFIPIIPLMAILSTRLLGGWDSSPRKRRWSGLLTTLILGWSLWYCLGALDLRMHDTRTKAARYIRQEIPAGTSIGLSITSEHFPWHYHGWHYPNVESSRYPIRPFLSRPEILIVSAYDMDPIAAALLSPHLSSNYEWDSAYNYLWHKASPPTPEIFRFYDRLLNEKESDYRLIKTFSRRNHATIEFGPPEIRIYQRLS